MKPSKFLVCAMLMLAVSSNAMAGQPVDSSEFDAVRESIKYWRERQLAAHGRSMQAKSEAERVQAARDACTAISGHVRSELIFRVMLNETICRQRDRVWVEPTYEAYEYGEYGCKNYKVIGGGCVVPAD